MEYAIPTTTRIVVTPAHALTIEHTRRCLVHSKGRIIETPVAVIVQYPAAIPVMLWVVLNSDGEPKYVDMNGWMFDDAVIERLILKKRIRHTT